MTAVSRSNRAPAKAPARPTGSSRNSARIRAFSNPTSPWDCRSNIASTAPRTSAESRAASSPAARMLPDMSLVAISNAACAASRISCFVASLASFASISSSLTSSANCARRRVAATLSAPNCAMAWARAFCSCIVANSSRAASSALERARAMSVSSFSRVIRVSFSRFRAGSSLCSLATSANRMRICSSVSSRARSASDVSPEAFAARV